MSTVYTLNGKVLKNAANDKWLKKAEAAPLPANTIRVRTSNGNAPVKTDASYETATLVAGTTDVYDVYKSGTNFAALLSGSSNVVEILGANTTGVTNMSSMFKGCTALTAIPTFDVSSVTNVNYAFQNCYNVESGITAMYTQMSAVVTSPFAHLQTFQNCGRDTTAGAAELAQLPSDWK